MVERSRKFFRDTVAEGIDADVAIARIESCIRHKRGVYVSSDDQKSLSYVIAGDDDRYSAPYGSPESAGDTHEGHICRDGDAIDRHDAISRPHARMIGRTVGERSHDDDLSGPYETHFGADPVECPGKMLTEYGCFFRREIARIVVAYGRYESADRSVDESPLREARTRIGLRMEPSVYIVEHSISRRRGDAIISVVVDGGEDTEEPSERERLIFAYIYGYAVLPHEHALEHIFGGGTSERYGDGAIRERVYIDASLEGFIVGRTLGYTAIGEVDGSVAWTDIGCLDARVVCEKPPYVERATEIGRGESGGYFVR